MSSRRVRRRSFFPNLMASSDGALLDPPASRSLGPGPWKPSRPPAPVRPSARPPVRPCLHPCACALYPPKGQSRRPRRRRRRPEWIFFKMSLLLRACASVRGRACIDPAAAAAAAPCVRARVLPLVAVVARNLCAPDAVRRTRRRASGGEAASIFSLSLPSLPFPACLAS